MKEKILKTISSSGLAQGGLVFLVATVLANLSNFVFHVVISRLLGPSNYGALGALLNVLIVFSVPLGAVQAAVTRAESAGIHADGHGIGLRSTMLYVFIVGVIATLVFIALSPVIGNYLHLRSPLPIMLLSTWVLPALLGAILQGVLVGRFRFSVVAVASVAGGVIGRLAFGIALVELGLGVSGAIVASVLGQLITTIVVLVPLLPEVVRSKRKAVGIGVRSGVHAVAALAGFWVLATEDTVLGRHFLSSHEAGLYASASTAGRMALFLPGAVSLLAFPKFARDKGRGELTRSTFRWSLTLTVLLGAVPAVILISMPTLVIDILFGHGYLGAANTVRILGIEGAGLGILGLLVYFHLARESLNSLYAWLGAALAFIGVEFVHASTVSIALVMLISVAAATGLSFVSALNTIRNNRKVEEFDFVEK